MHKLHKPNLESKILIIDDNEDDRQIMERFLHKAGFKNLHFASDGFDGMKQAKEGKPDLIILDIVMPKKNGTEIAELLHSDGVTRSIPIIFVTSLVRSEEQQGGHTRVFGKPFNTEEFLKKIEKVLEKAA